MPPWLRLDRNGAVVISLHVQPGARKTEIVGIHGEALKVKLAAPPIEGKANLCLIEFLAERLGIAKECVAIVAGATSRHKRVRLTETDSARVLALAPPV